MESQSCVEFCRLSWCPDSIPLNISVTPKSLFLTSTKGLLPEHWQTGHTVGGLVWDWVWEETPHGANNMVLDGNSFCFHSVVEWKEEVWKKLYRNKTEKKKKQDWKKEKKKKKWDRNPYCGSSMPSTYGVIFEHWADEWMDSLLSSKGIRRISFIALIHLFWLFSYKFALALLYNLFTQSLLWFRGKEMKATNIWGQGCSKWWCENCVSDTLGIAQCTTCSAVQNGPGCSVPPRFAVYSIVSSRNIITNLLKISVRWESPLFCN